MSELLEFALLGILSGGVTALVALGFVLIYKGSGVVNFASGEIMMLGAYFYYTATVMLGLAPVLALGCSLAGIVAVALTVERLVLRPLSGQPTIAALMATIGLASMLHGGVEMTWGGDTHTVPSLLPRTPLLLGEILIPGTMLGNFVVAVVVVAALLLFFRFTKTGIGMRAVASDPVTASTLGVDIHRSQALTWILSGSVGTLAGVLIGGTAGLSPMLATAALAVFAAVILGGLDSIAGAIVASLIVGCIDAFATGYLGGKARDVVPYLVVLAILVVRPYGIFGTRAIERI